MCHVMRKSVFIRNMHIQDILCNKSYQGLDIYNQRYQIFLLAPVSVLDIRICSKTLSFSNYRDVDAKYL